MNRIAFAPLATFAVAFSCAAVTAQRLIVIDTTPAADPVYVMDPATAAMTPIGTISSNNGVPGSLSYDITTGKLYSSDTATDNIFTLDVTNWQATLVGNLGIPALIMHAIEIDPITGVLYGMSPHDAGLYQIDTTTGAATLIGLTGLPASTVNGLSLAFDPATQQMFMARRGLPNLYTIDLATAAITVVGPHNIGAIGDMAFDLDDGRIYAIDNIADNAYWIDPVTGAATLIAHLNIAGTVNPNIISMAYIPGAGRFTRSAGACGPTTITPWGIPAPSGTINTTLGGVTAFPFIGVGFTPVGVPFCGCVIGHDWSFALFGDTLQFVVPQGQSSIGTVIYLQGMDFLGTGGCASPQVTLTDTITLTIG